MRSVGVGCKSVVCPSALSPRIAAIVKDFPGIAPDAAPKHGPDAAVGPAANVPPNLVPEPGSPPEMSAVLAVVPSVSVGPGNWPRKCDNGDE